MTGFVEEATRGEGVSLAELPAMTTLYVRTANSLYRIVVVEPSHPKILVRGGPLLPEATEASLGGGSMKVAWIGVGLPLEIFYAGKRFLTSPVRSIAVQNETSLPGPF